MARVAPSRRSEDDTTHAWAADPGRHPEDDRLRAAGFVIHDRPPRPAEPIWRGPSGELLTQTEALRTVRSVEDEIDAAFATG